MNASRKLMGGSCRHGRCAAVAVSAALCNKLCARTKTICCSSFAGDALGGLVCRWEGRVGRCLCSLGCALGRWVGSGAQSVGFALLKPRLAVLR